MIKHLLEDITKIEKGYCQRSHILVVTELAFVALRMLGVAIAKYIGEVL
jgi:hypothetical protein